mgnify:CR=1 FL=1
MKVRSYIVLLTSASLLGALMIAVFAWYTYDRLEEATNSYEKEKNLYGDSSTELEDINALLSVVRNIFTAMEIYPENYDGLFSVAFDGITSAKGGLNEISRKYGERFPETLLRPIVSRIQEIEKKIKKLQEIAISSKDENWLETKMAAKREYDEVREKLMRNLDMLEAKAIQNLQESNESLKIKSLDLDNRKSTTEYSIVVAVICYVTLIFILALITYLSIAAPLAKLEGAATQSIQNRKPFNCVEEGPHEVRSLTSRLQGLILGLEDAVKDRTAKLLQRTEQLKAEIKQRKELETQLVHAQKMEAVGQLASGIAHEINSPSQFASDNILFLKEAVEGFIAKIDNSQEAPDEKEITFLKENAPEAVQQANEGISRITTIVKSMKNFAYRDAESAKKPNDLNQAIKSTIVVATNEWKYHAELETKLDSQIPMVPCNIGEINQVVLNLIVNGAHAIRDRYGSGQKGILSISTKHYVKDECVIISITDNGGGIPAKVQARIFEPFFTTKEVGVGTGQGLAIAHNVIVKSHNGQIWFQSTEGQGTTFFIKLPMHQG